MRINIWQSGPSSSHGGVSTRGRWSQLGLIATTLLVLLAGEVAPAGAVSAVGGLRGHPLTEALNRLQALGLRVIFSDTLVPAKLKVTTEPLESEPRALLEELLLPHGLIALESESGILVVVRRARDGEGKWPVARIGGTVVSRRDRRPLVAVTVVAQVEGEKVAFGSTRPKP